MSLVRFMNLHPNSDFVDVGTVERELLFIIGDLSRCGCIHNALTAILLSY